MPKAERLTVALTVQERVTDAAADLGLLDLEADPDRLLLLQLPSLLPVPASSLPSHQRPGQPIKRLGQPEACSLNQLPSGKVSLACSRVVIR